MSAPGSPGIRTLQRPLSYHPDWGMPPSGTTQYIVINPMHVVTLRDRSRTFAVRCVEKIKEISEKWFTHVLLILLLMGYAALGAVVFQMIEGPLEDREKIIITSLREHIINVLVNATSRGVSENNFRALAYKRLKEYEAQIQAATKTGIGTDSESRQWTFWGAMFYCGTVFTTIGYGNICPNTDAGRAATIVYSFLGIPIMLMVLADLGKLFTRAIKYLFNVVRQFYYTGKCKKVRKVGKKASPVQFITVAWNKMPDMPYKRNSKGDILEDNPTATTATDNKTDVEAAKPKEEKNDSEKEKKDKKKDKELDKKKLIIPEPDGKFKPEIESPSIVEEAPPFEVDDEFNLPISLALILLVAYINLGAFVFTLWEDWSFFEAVYFVFISMSTIGFGDYVPEHPMFMMATFIYLLFGLALTSMCINVVQEKLADVFEAAKLRLGTTMGLDINALMAEEALNNAPNTEIADVHGKKGSPEKDKGTKKENVKDKDGKKEKDSKKDKVKEGQKEKDSKKDKDKEGQKEKESKKDNGKNIESKSDTTIVNGKKSTEI